MSDDEGDGDYIYESSESEEEELEADDEENPIDTIITDAKREAHVILVPPEERRTSNVLTKTEMAFVISMRARQIETSGTTFVEIGDLNDPGKIAAKELYERRCPLLLRRIVGHSANGDPIVEQWDIKTMTYP